MKAIKLLYRWDSEEKAKKIAKALSKLQEQGLIEFWDDEEKEYGLCRNCEIWTDEKDCLLCGKEVEY